MPHRVALLALLPVLLIAGLISFQAQRARGGTGEIATGHCGGGLGGDDFYEQNDTILQAAEIFPPTNDFPLITCSGDEDYYFLHLAAGAELHIDLTFLQNGNDIGRGDIDVDVIDSSLAVVAEGHSRVANESIVYVTPLSSNYYIHVYRYGSPVASDKGVQYRMNVQTYCSDDDLEDNDSGPASSVVPLPFHRADLRICPFDKDNYLVPASTGEEIKAGVTFNHEEANVNLFLWRPDNSLAGSSTGITTDSEKIHFIADQSGNYHVTVQSEPANFEGATYKLDLEVRPVGAPTLTWTPTRTRTPTNTPILSATPTPRNTVTPTRSPTGSPPATATSTPTITETRTPTPTRTYTPTRTLSATRTATGTPPTATRSATATATQAIPSITPSVTTALTLTPTRSPTPPATPTATATRTPTLPPTPTATATTYRQFGDVDCNRLVTSVDATLMLQVIAGFLQNVACPQNIDVNGDGLLTSVDPSLVLQLLAGLIHVLPG
jgi:hypothetical protein